MIQRLRAIFDERRRSARAGTLLAAVVGMLALSIFGGPIRSWSYDLPFHLRFLPASRIHSDDAIVVTIDDDTFLNLQQDANQPLDRKLHAQLMDRLFSFGAKAVILDLLFDQASNPSSDAALTMALKAHRNALIVAKVDRKDDFNLQTQRIISPIPIFGQTNWGVASYEPDGHDDVVRRHFDSRQLSGDPSIGEKLAERLGIKHGEASGGRWINFYGPPSFPTYRYWQLLKEESDWSRVINNKIVFVGWGDVATRFRGPEIQRTPVGPLYGVILNAHAGMNYVRYEWLEEWPLSVELLFVLAFGAAVGFGFVLLRPQLTLGVACILFVSPLLLEILLRARLHVWWPWLVAAAVQVPTGLAFCTATHIGRLRGRGAPDLPSSSDLNAPARIPTATEFNPPLIPDYTLLKLVGSGSCGEVWLARSTIGLFRAVKVVHRARFKTPRPFEREFSGVSSFAPKSLSYAGLLRILHVGLRESEGWFFYVMEAGDDIATDQSIDPKNYRPRSLHEDLKAKEKLPLDACLDLGIQLAAALRVLHDELGLVHRDIKPSNIIFVDGVPKLADVGLVKNRADCSDDMSYVGTEGYIPPEGTGTAQADIFSLGKVLYEASMGLDRTKYPDLPSSLLERPDREDFLRLNEIIMRACERSPKRRYQSAAKLEADLQRLRRRIAKLNNRTARGA